MYFLWPYREFPFIAWRELGLMCYGLRGQARGFVFSGRRVTSRDLLTMCFKAVPGFSNVLHDKNRFPLLPTERHSIMARQFIRGRVINQQGEEGALFPIILQDFPPPY